MKSNYVARAQQFVHLIAPYFVSCHEEYQFERATHCFLKDHPHRRVYFTHGYTRVALITSDYVIKIDYNEYGISSFGGCEKEIELYKRAASMGMAHLFAEITRYEYNGRIYYIMPRVEDIDEDRAEDAWDFMTEDERDWCEDCGLSDLHGGNFGFLHGHMVIIDYACYGKWAIKSPSFHAYSYSSILLSA